MTPILAVSAAILALSILVACGVVAFAAHTANRLAAAWVQYGVEYQKMFLKRDEDAARYFRDAMELQREVASTAHERYVGLARQVTTPSTLHRIAELNSAAQASQAIGNASQALARQMHDDLVDASGGESPLPMPPLDPFSIPTMRPQP